MAQTKINLGTQGLTGTIIADLFADGAVGASAIAAGSIVNSHIGATAAIDYGKLNLSGSIVDADVNASAAIAYSKLSLSGSIVDADISAVAAIADGKLAEQYINSDGTRAMGATLDMGSNAISNLLPGVTGTDAVNKAQMDAAIDAVTSTVNTFEWQESAKSYILDNTQAPPTEVTGDRYVLSSTGGIPHADWDGAAAGDIVQFDGAVWAHVTPAIGTFIAIDDNVNALYLFDGAWSVKQFEQTQAGLGLTKSGFTLSVDPTLAGNGLSYSSGVMAVVGATGILVGNDYVAVNVGTGANQIVQLNASSQLPAVDGSLVTLVDADKLDGIHAAGFLRSDTTTAFTLGTFSFASGTVLSLVAGSQINVAGTFKVAGVTMTSSAAELNLLTGATVTTTELNALGTIVIRETPTGALDGNNVDFYLANSPMAGTEEVYLNGILQDVGALADYVISGNHITFAVAPLSTDKVRVSYRW